MLALHAGTRAYPGPFPRQEGKLGPREGALGFGEGMLGLGDPALGLREGSLGFGEAALEQKAVRGASGDLQPRLKLVAERLVAHAPHTASPHRATTS